MRRNDGCPLHLDVSGVPKGQEAVCVQSTPISPFRPQACERSGYRHPQQWLARTVRSHRTLSSTAGFEFRPTECRGKSGPGRAPDADELPFRVLLQGNVVSFRLNPNGSQSFGWCSLHDWSALAGSWPLVGQSALAGAVHPQPVRPAAAVVPCWLTGGLESRYRRSLPEGGWREASVGERERKRKTRDLGPSPTVKGVLCFAFSQTFNRAQGGRRLLPNESSKRPSLSRQDAQCLGNVHRAAKCKVANYQRPIELYHDPP